MKARPAVLLLSSIALGSSNACKSQDFSGIRNEGAPNAGGVIAAIDPGRGYRLDDSLSSPSPRQVFFRVSAATTIEHTSGQKGTFPDLVVGTTVVVWAASQVPNASPPEITARLILIYDRR